MRSWKGKRSRKRRRRRNRGEEEKEEERGVFKMKREIKTGIISKYCLFGLTNKCPVKTPTSPGILGAILIQRTRHVVLMEQGSKNSIPFIHPNYTYRSNRL